MNHKIISMILLINFLIISLNGVFVIKTGSVSVVYDNEKNLQLEFHFSIPTFEYHGDSTIIRVRETNLNQIIDGKPVLPVNITTLEFKFGTKILKVDFSYPKPIIFNLTHPLIYAQEGGLDGNTISNGTLSNTDEFYPDDWISYHTGGGLSYGVHKTFFVLRVYPVRCNSLKVYYIPWIKINIRYLEPKESIIRTPSVYDLLIISPSIFIKYLQPLVLHKESVGISTKLVSLDEIYDKIFWYGRDEAEKIKYFIKQAVETWGVRYVLLVGGVDGQTFRWLLPVRYSHVIPGENDQEYIEPAFLSDLYYADIYDSNGNFSSWDSNDDNIFSLWNTTFREEMDLYPDVYLGRLPCRNIREVKIMVDKIINYEKKSFGKSWFKNLVLVGGDSYNDKMGFNEGELICDEVEKHMPGFNAIKVYASQNDINRRTVNSALNPGCGFAYFVGHGSPGTWNTHFPPHGSDWTTGYSIKDMIPLRNKDRYPITVVGGCHNGQFNVSLMNIILGLKKEGLHYFSSKPGNFGGFWYREWVPNCWAWWFTSKRDGGAIATIANTGLGTHGENDLDYNGVADYLEILDGWLELRFFKIFGEENQRILGENHGESITEYLHRFLGNNDRMDVKMIQQWELFGDPSLMIGGYPH